MSADLRVVLDTNVVISALLLRRSLTRQAFDHASSHGIVLVSAETVEELDDVLRRRKFEKYVGLLALHPFRKVPILAPARFIASTP